MFTTPLPETFGALQRVYRAVDRYRRKMLRSRSWGEALTNASDQIKQRFPLLRQNCIQLGVATLERRLAACGMSELG